MECSSCGNHFHGQSRKNSSGRKYGYYVDSGFSTHGPEVCGRNLIRQDLVEDFVIKKIKKLVLDRINRQALERRIKEKLHAKLVNGRSSISELNSKLSDTKRKIQNLVDSVAGGMDYRLAKNSLETLDRERQKIESRKAVMSGTRQLEWDEDKIAKSIVENLDEVESAFQSAEPFRIKEVLKSLVHKIVVNPRKRRVFCFFFGIPLPTEIRNSVVCLTVPEGGIEPPRGVSPAGF